MDWTRSQLTYHCWVDKGTPAALLLKQGEDKRDDGGTEEDYDQLVLELLKNKLPNGRGRLFGDGCTRTWSVCLHGSRVFGGAMKGFLRKRTIAAMLLPQLVNLVVGQAGVLVNLEVRKHLLG